ncbi:MAG: hypothetical protein IJR00_12400 [Lachnospiraceae bacterium]|nr:hypothetical protein [Lachnospiraceae bacterium]
MKRYEIWDAYVKYEGVDHVEIRPVLVWGKNAFIAAYKMTGTDRGDDGKEYRIKYWKESGLSKPTSVRLGKFLKLEDRDMVRFRGVLDKRDQMMLDFRIIG